MVPLPNEDVVKVTNNAPTEKEKLNLRREARRRKILDDAKGRLDRLNGRINNVNVADATKEQVQEEQPKQSQNEHSLNDFIKATNIETFANDEQYMQWSDPEVEPDDIIIPPAQQHHQQQLQQLHRLQQQQQHQNQRTQQQPFPTNNDDILNFFATTTTNTTATKKPQHFILRCRAHIILATLLSYLISIFSSSASSYSAFIPIGLCLVIELIYFRQQEQINPLTMLLITLSGLRTDKVAPIMQMFQRLQSLATDLGIFVFIYCSLTYLLFFFNKSYADFVKIA